MNGGVALSAASNPTMANPALVYPQNIDPGLVTYDRNFEIKSINWKAIVAGLSTTCRSATAAFGSPAFTRAFGPTTSKS